MHGYGNWGTGYWYCGGFFTVLTYILLVFLLVFLIKRLRGKSVRRDEALDILKRRYAAGEISKEQFESMKKDILN
jgi:putative membrane protein